MGTKMKALELEIDSYKEACSSEEREKADITTAEKKARGQVRKTKDRPVMCHVMCLVIQHAQMLQAGIDTGISAGEGEGVLGTQKVGEAPNRSWKLNRYKQDFSWGGLRVYTCMHDYSLYYFTFKVHVTKKFQLASYSIKNKQLVMQYCVPPYNINNKGLQTLQCVEGMHLPYIIVNLYMVML